MNKPIYDAECGQCMKPETREKDNTKEMGVGEVVKNLIYQLKVAFEPVTIETWYSSAEDYFIDKLRKAVHQELQKARVQEKVRIKTLLEDLPAFTPCSDKTMGKVSDEAKKPAYLTNYLERETVLALLNQSELDQPIS